MYLGKKEYISTNQNLEEKYSEIAQKDEKSAKILEREGLYNHAAYFYIQSMEKYIKSNIAKKINLTNQYFADEMRKTMGHSIDGALELLLKVYTVNNPTLEKHMKEQLLDGILQNTRFKALNNILRYPIYNPKSESYTFSELTKEDCQTLNSMLSQLKRYLTELVRIK